jgi:hypothetical protein
MPLSSSSSTNKDVEGDAKETKTKLDSTLSHIRALVQVVTPAAQKTWEDGVLLRRPREVAKVKRSSLSYTCHMPKC